MLRKAFLAAVAALLLPALLAAEIVVLKDGRRIEARGRYTVEAGMVKFTVNGTLVLSSLSIRRIVPVNGADTMFALSRTNK